MMVDVNAGEQKAEGRPGAGAELVQGMAEAKARRPRRKDIRPLAHLLPFVAAHKADGLAAGFFLLFSTGATLGLTAAFKGVIDHGFAKGHAAAINSAFVGLGAVALVLAIATAARFFFITRLGERVVADLRRALYGHTLTLDQQYFLKTRTGEVLSRLTTDVSLIEQLVGVSASVALRNILSLVGGLTYMAVVSPKLAGFIVVMVPVVLAPMFLVGRRVRKLTVSAQDKFADAVGYAGESLDALETVQAFGREASSTARFGAAVEAAYKASVRRITTRAAMTAMVITLAFGGITLLLWTGARLVLSGEMTGGTLAQFAMLAVMAAGSIGALGEVWGDVQKASGAMDRISELLNAKPDIAAPATPKALPVPAQGAIAFENVTFAYPGRPDLPALNGFDLTVKPGETVALVGPSGAGKSTVLRLLLRFYDPQVGAIRLDGVDLRDAEPAEVRARMALVAQDSPLFSGSAFDNIRFGREDASEAELRAAAQAAQAAGFLSALPQGFDTPVGERAKTLSGGQRQRLAIARALVREAPILLLDEATSALDAESERLVQQALHAAMTGRTTLVIAHRLATVLKADRIVVMEEGRVVEQGAHAELFAKGGLYARLASLQFGVEAA
ncbi:ABC transporter transmembrane domain-containing protein [uncultured Caulobacter sp.]|uniref:ABC transporter transmembrane domain-containing protein n=1 Tax=uncultured Caulobacter sp. TaxID=158749 RepID=UPI0026137F63|nr:ABC transporter transmembrane domain-containing protein [uncultured Caulobacter sp.]